MSLFSLIYPKVVYTLTIFLFCTSSLFADDIWKIDSPGNRLFYKSSESSYWKKLSKGIPEKAHIKKIYSSGTRYYVTTDYWGIFTFKQGESSWKAVNDKDFRSRSRYALKGPMRPISAFTVDPKNSNRIVCATKHRIYISYNAGKKWHRIKRKGLTSQYYYTSAAIRGSNLYVGTSFNGIYKITKNRLISYNKGLPKIPYSKSMFFYNEISSLHITEKGNLIALPSMPSEVYALKKGKRLWKKIDLPSGFNKGNSIYCTPLKGNNANIYQNNNIIKINSSLNKIIRTTSINTISNTYPGYLVYPVKPSRKKTTGVWLIKETPSSLQNKSRIIKALYVNVYTLRKNLNKFISITKKTPINALVIDMKDDFGIVHYPSTNKIAKKIGAVRKTLKIKKILKKLQKAGIYTIARLVIFKDQKLYKAYKNKYAIRNIRNGKPWKGNPKEYWVDPHAPFVHRYNRDLALECEGLGFDEIQFDYIRFPSDGPTHLCSYPFRKDPETYKSEILGDFLYKAKKALKIPLSVDIYGFNAWYRFGNRIGQDINLFSHIVDIICPMVYPSHFGSRFWRSTNRKMRSYDILYQSGIRSKKIAQGKAAIRPYLQAFNMLSPTWSPGYIYNQIKGAADSGCSGYTFWNAAGNYKMVIKSYRKK